MEEIAVSKFKATCLSVLKRVSRTGEPVRITRFGKPVAEIVPPAPASQPRRVLGEMKHTGKIIGDIVSPVVAEDEWEVLRS